MFEFQSNNGNSIVFKEESSTQIFDLTQDEIQEVSSLSEQDIIQDNDNTISTEAVKKWTFMIYIAADNDLEDAAIDDFIELERAKQPSSEVNVIVLMDRISGYDTRFDDWTDTRYYRIAPDTSPAIDAVLLKNIGEASMDSPGTLRDFIEYCFDKYPAENYLLDLWDHGAGVFGVCFDDTSGSGAGLTVGEIGSAIGGATKAYDETIDILTIDACLMNTLEVAYEVRDYCDFLVASEENIPWDGFDYEPILSGVEVNPDISVKSLCTLIVSSYRSTYLENDYTCLSTINLTMIKSIDPYINSFATNLIDAIDIYGAEFLLFIARGAAQGFYDEDMVDLYGLAQSVEMFFELTELKNSAHNLAEFLDEVIVSNWQHDSFNDKANGITVFYPVHDLYHTTAVLDAYANAEGRFAGCDFILNTEWPNFIDKCNEVYQLQAPESPPIIDEGTETEQFTISENQHNQFLINLLDADVYNFQCIIETGDVDITVISSTSSGYSVKGKSLLVNPDDGANEECQLYLPANMYYIFVIGRSEISTYSIKVNSVNIPKLRIGKNYNISIGTINGDESGHFAQDYRQYYSFSLNPTMYTIVLNNSASTDFYFRLYDEEWNLINYRKAAGAGADIQYSYTPDEKLNCIIEIYGNSGSGSFEFQIVKGDTLKSGPSAIAFGLISILSLILIRSSQKFKKRRNS